MANQILSMNKLHLVLRLLIEGKSQRHISRVVEISRNTVDKYACIFNSHPLSLSELYKLDDFNLQTIVKSEYQSKSSFEDVYKSFSSVLKELKRVGVTKKILWTAYKTKAPVRVGYSQYCDHLNKHLKNHQFSYVSEHKAADNLMIDFADKKLYLTDYDIGEQVPVEFLRVFFPIAALPLPWLVLVNKE
jgi:predicted DNA-binding protein YlxM (UPF0122 family)